MGRIVYSRYITSGISSYDTSSGAGADIPEVKRDRTPKVSVLIYQKPSGLIKPSVRSATFFVKFKSSGSLQYLLTIWIPTGSPSSPIPVGSETAGFPDRLKQAT